MWKHPLLVKTEDTRGAKRIIVIKRWKDYHACLNDHPEIWGCGCTVDEAVGSCVLYHGEHFGFEVEVEG